MEEKKVSVLVVGATFFGLGVAIGAGKRAKVIERSIMAGPEFICTYRESRGFDEALKHEKTLVLKEEFKKRNILGENDKVHIPAMQPVLYNLIKNENIDISFSTEFISAVKNGAEYEAELFDVSGYKRTFCKKIVDTTALCITRPELNVNIKSKSINALIHSKEDLTKPDDIEGVKFFFGNCNGEVYMKYPLDKNDDIIRAREKLHKFWQTRPEILKNWSLDAVATEMEIIPEPDSKNDENFLWYPSSAYNNPLKAFDEGISLGLRLI